ncbi:unnamed protein product [Owenia fusiformis]|uniref:Uncharacterized protein n=1 Tax=Owenia fusiformis TaxID=6347 RepID=A0A8J1UEX3_OWEFU|nr:unnamed protein product [Owenia fusiformis]
MATMAPTTHLSQWQQVTMTGNEKVDAYIMQHYHDQGIDLTVREKCALLIESRYMEWKTVSTPNSQSDDINYAVPLVQELANECFKQKDKLSNSQQNNYVAIQTLASFGKKLQQEIQDQGSAVQFAARMSHCLQMERDILDQIKKNPKGEIEIESEMEKKIKMIDLQLRDIEKGLKDLGELQKEVRANNVELTNQMENCKRKIQEQGRQNNTNKVNELKRQQQEIKQKRDNEFNMKAVSILQVRQHLSGKCATLVPDTETLKNQMLKEIDTWQKVEKMKVVSKITNLWLTSPELKKAHTKTQLDDIETRCSKLARTLWKLFQCTQSLNQMVSELNLTTQDGSSQNIAADVRKLLEDVHANFSSLLEKSLVIEIQSLQVLVMSSTTNGTSENVNFTLRLLAGRDLDIGKMMPQAISAGFYSEKELMHAERLDTDKPSLQLTNNNANLAPQGYTKSVVASFQNMRVTKFRRGKRGAQEVGEQMYGVLFQANIKLGEIMYTVKTISKPLTLVVKSCQEPNSLCNLVWYSAFSEPNALPYKYPSDTLWRKLACVLNNMFHNHNGKGLEERHINFLRFMAFNGSDVDNESCITREKFCKDRMNGKDFTFWRWFYACLNLTNDHLKEAWKEGLVEGFISGQDCIAQLEDPNIKAHNFILRFSASEIDDNQKMKLIGKLVPTVKIADGLVQHIEPQSGEELTKKGSLGRLLLDIPSLEYLYPDRPVQETFKNYTSKKKAKDNQELRPNYIGLNPKAELKLTEEVLEQINNRQTEPDYNIPSVSSIGSQSVLEDYANGDSVDDTIMVNNYSNIGPMYQGFEQNQGGHTGLPAIGSLMQTNSLDMSPSEVASLLQNVLDPNIGVQEEEVVNNGALSPQQNVIVQPVNHDVFMPNITNSGTSSGDSLINLLNSSNITQMEGDYTYNNEQTPQ